MPSKRPKPTTPSKELKEIWDKVPAMKNCQGKCQGSCGPIPISGEEKRLVEAHSGHGLDWDTTTWKCNMLSKTGYCTVYSVRPLICRIWAATKRLPCPHGCEPERWLNDEETMALFKEVERLGDDDEGRKAALDMLGRMSPKQRAEYEGQRRAYHKERGVIGDGRDA